MAQQLTVKAYLKRWNAQLMQQEMTDEIRRFAVDYDVSTSYEYLLAKITSVFPGLVNKSITIYWKDADGDMIAFSSDDELMEAMRSVSDGLFRIYIIEKQGMGSATCSSAPPPRENNIHFGVTCDGCEGPVVGVRYKCNVCPDYDLCSGCKGLGLHSEHEMKTITTPILPWMFHGGFAGPCGAGPCGAGPMGMPPPPPPPPYGFCPPPPHPMPLHGFPGAGMENPCEMRRAWKRWYRETYGDDHKRKKQEKKEMKREQKKQRKEQKAEEKGKQSADGNKSSSSSSSESEGDASPGAEYLKNVGQSVAAMLDPLGIDVQVDVETHGQRRRCHRMGMRGGPGGWGGHGMRGHGFGGPFGGGFFGGMGGGRGRWGGGGGAGGCPWRMRFSAQAAAAAGQPAEQPGQQQQQQNGPAESCASAAAAPPSQAHHQNSETGEMASGQFNTAAAMTDPDWTLVNDGSSASCALDVEDATEGVEHLHVSAPLESVPMMPLYPALPADPKIAEALETMMQMGYGNEGGWLTQLLVAHNGDIGRALDAIHAKK